MSRWYSRFLRHTFHGKALMTEETLQDIAREVSRLRSQLAEVLQEVTLAMQALDLVSMRLGNFEQAPPQVEQPRLAVVQPQPVTLTQERRQRNGE